jgi:hypothetical protein
MIVDVLLRRINASIEQLMEDLRQLKRSDYVISLIQGGTFTLEEAADVWECSIEKIRKECERAARTRNPLGVKRVNGWIIGKPQLFELIERKDGKPERIEAETRARKYDL